MFPLGFLFGLGFDTTMEIAVPGISATEAAKGISIWSIMVFPTLFAVGMSAPGQPAEKRRNAAYSLID